MPFVEVGRLRVARPLYELVRTEIAPGTGLDPEAVWTAFGTIVDELGPRNRELLEVRAEHERRLHDWHRERIGKPVEAGAYRDFLVSTGYLVPEGDGVRGHNEERRSRDRADRGPAARGTRR